MKLNFTSEKYKEKARKSLGYAKVESTKTMSEAFMLLIKDVSKEDLSNLCSKIKMELGGKVELTEEECYELTQGSECILKKVSNETEIGKIEKYLLNLAYECLQKDKVHLGDKKVQNGINTSAWINKYFSIFPISVSLLTFFNMHSEP